MKVYLDSETAGLLGKIYSVQHATDKDFNPVWFFPDEDQKRFDRLVGLLYQESTLLIGYNIGFDIWKFYQLLHVFHGYSLASRKNVIPPFKCRYLDLLNHVKAHPVLGILNAGKKIVKLSRIPNNKYEDGTTTVDKVCSVVEKMLQKSLQLPIKLGKVVSREKDTKNLVSITYSIQSSQRLKEIMKILGEKDTQEITDLFKFPTWDERALERYPTIPKELEGEYERLWRENKEILRTSKNAQKYALNDIRYLQVLEKYLGYPLPNPNDTNVGIVAYMKYHGIPVDQEGAKEDYYKLKGILEEFKGTEARPRKCPFDPDSPKQKLEYIRNNVISGIPAPVKTTKDIVKLYLKEGWFKNEAKPWLLQTLMHKSDSQKLKQLETMAFSETGSLHPDFVSYGTQTNRTKATGGFNAQGVSKKPDGPRRFLRLSQGGDWNSLELVIAEAFFQDPAYTQDFVDGINLHLMTACLYFEGMPTYEEGLKILKDEKHPRFQEVTDARSAAKRINFGILYFCTAFKVAQILKCTEEEAERRMNETFFSRYPSFLEARRFFKETFCTADTEHWTPDSVSDMAEGVWDFFKKNKRSCVFEKRMAELFWKNAHVIAKQIGANNKERNILRSTQKGRQTEYGAVLSACYGAALRIQAAVSRAMGNSPIQGSGSDLTKRLQEKIWYKHWVPMFNVHDEINVPTGYEGLYPEIKNTVDTFIEDYKKHIRFLAMDWIPMKTWADKR